MIYGLSDAINIMSIFIKYKSSVIVKKKLLSVS